VADGMYVPFDARQGVHPEFDSYGGDAIKQADVVMLTYPWEFPIARQGGRPPILAYYAPRSDPSGPSMTDAIHSIVARRSTCPAASTTPILRGRRDPFLQAPFEQFHETRSGGAFTFMTAVGGYLQAYIYGFSGLRWRADHVELDPTLPPQLPGVVLRNVHWQGRTFTVAIGPQSTHVALDSGASMTLAVRACVTRWFGATRLTWQTRRPISPRPATWRVPSRPRKPGRRWTSTHGRRRRLPGHRWVPSSSQDALIVDLGSARRLTGAVLQWVARGRRPTRSMPRPTVSTGTASPA